MVTLAMSLILVVLPSQDNYLGEHAPVSISSHAIVPGRNGGEEIQLSMVNHSSTQVIGCALIVTFLDAEGKPFLTSTRREAVVDDETPTNGRGGPGDVWLVRLRNLPRLEANGSIPPYSVDVDYVSFSDGTSWGMDRSNSGPYFEGFKEGTRILKGKLRDKLENEGSEAVKAYLRRK